MTGFWAEALAEQTPQRPLPPPTIPQQPPEAVPSFENFWEQAGQQLQGPEPASSFEELHGFSPGQDIMGVPSGRTSKAQRVTLDSDGIDRDRDRKQMALAVKLATAAGRFDGSDTGKAAHDRATEVQALIKEHAFDITEDGTPRRAADTRIAGVTWR